MKKIVFLLFSCAPFFAFSQGAFIHIDQFGYTPQAEKVAVISDPQVGYNSALSFTPSNILRVKNANTNATVYSAAIQIWDNGITHNTSGDKGWWFDFSPLTTPGTYFIFDSLNNERSHTFLIGDNPYYDAFKDAGRMFYYNRCNHSKALPFAHVKWTDGNNFNKPKQDGECYPIYDSTNAQLKRNLSGGWFDAGDYNKYVSFTYSTLHNLLNAYEENPSAFGDDWNIPESGNGIPDIIDEIKWETDWLLKMVDSNGLTPIKVGSKNYWENSSHPPSANSYPRYYGPHCTSASISAASVLAHAGLVMKNFPPLLPYVDSLKFKAKVATEYVRPFFYTNSFQTNCDDGSIVAGNTDVDSVEQTNRLMTASIYLWELTNDLPSKNFIDFNYFVLVPYVDYNWNPYNNSLTDALIRYAKHPNAGANASFAILANISTHATNDWSDYYGWSETDLYRAPVPSWTFHWGSNQYVATYGNMNNKLADHKIGFDSLDQRKRASENLHYFHGVNPNGLVYLSNMYGAGAEKSCNEIYHAWFADGSIWDNAISSTNGVPPGYLVGGPNQYVSNTTLTPPFGQPYQKSYLDYNTGWPGNSWEVSEPAIYYQAAYLRLLSKYVKPLVATPTETIDYQKSKVRIYPNPTSEEVFIEGLNENTTIRFYTISGQLMKSVLSPTDRLRISLDGFSKGFYLVTFSTDNTIEHLKLIIR